MLIHVSYMRPNLLIPISIHISISLALTGNLVRDDAYKHPWRYQFSVSSRLHVKEDVIRGFLWFLICSSALLMSFLQQRNLSSLSEPFSFPQISFYSRERRVEQVQRKIEFSTCCWSFLSLVAAHTIFLYPWGTADKMRLRLISFLSFLHHLNTAVWSSNYQ